MPDDRDDPDRAAILARRNRVIAIAMSGFTLAGACGESEEPARPSVEQTQEQTQIVEPAPPEPPHEPPPQEPVEPPPQPCLEVAVPDEPEPDDTEQQLPVPRPCLSVRRIDPPPPEDETVPPSLEPVPQVCLTPMPTDRRKIDV